MCNLRARSYSNGSVWLQTSSKLNKTKISAELYSGPDVGWALSEGQIASLIWNFFSSFKKQQLSNTELQIQMIAFFDMQHKQQLRLHTLPCATCRHFFSAGKTYKFDRIWSKITHCKRLFSGHPVKVVFLFKDSRTFNVETLYLKHHF